MEQHVYKLTEIAGTSSESIEAAIRNALDRAGRTIRNIRWFEVTGQRGFVNDAGEVEFQVTLKVGFTLD